MKYDKLVRDKIPEIIKKRGGRATTHVADDKEYKQKLHEKLREEVDEFLRQPNEEELADVMEVLDAIIRLHTLSRKKARGIQKEKAEKRGHFEKQIILDEATWWEVTG